MFKHLHGRGEEDAAAANKAAEMETPPRTWKRHCLAGRLLEPHGNTSTDVEKTAARSASSCRGQKHLHGRGEDPGAPRELPPLLETPPRTWRRHISAGDLCYIQRNTSTDVEKTLWRWFRCHSFQKHLHGRGEDSFTVP